MVNDKTRVDLKMEAKRFINKHRNIKFLFIPLVILTLIQIITQDTTTTTVFNGEIANVEYNASYNLLSILISLLLVFVQVTISFKILDYLRNPEEYENLSGTDMLLIIFKGFDKYALNVFLVTIVASIFIFLGFIALIIPGIILSLGYSQMFYVLKEKTDNNKYSGVLDTLSESFRIMKGHKMDFFILGLSFIGWYLVIGITFGIAGVWIYPYIYTTYALFFENLLVEKELN